MAENDHVNAHKKLFEDALRDAISKKRNNTAIMKRAEIAERVERLKQLNAADCQRSTRDYSLERMYSLMEVQGTVGGAVYKLVKKGTNLRFMCFEDTFDIIRGEHLSKMHPGRDIMYNALKQQYANITKEIITLYVQYCEHCHLKKSKQRKKLVVKPIISNSFNSRAQVDLIDMQAEQDGEYRFILVYQDHLTKMVQLRALKSKRAVDVADVLVDIFCTFGAPFILQSDNGREFANRIVQNVVTLWPDCHIVHGKPRHSQSQGSVERANRDIENMLACWKAENPEKAGKWSEGLRFVQLQKNMRYHSGIGRTPYESVFGTQAKVGLESSPLDRTIIASLETEEQFLNAMGLEEEDSGEEIGDNPVEGLPGTTRDNLVDSNETHMESKAPLICVSCQNPSSGAHTCAECGNFCHAIDPCSKPLIGAEEGFGSKVLCYHCYTSENILETRKGAKRKQMDQASKMLEKSAKRVNEVSVGDTVLVPIPDVDRGRCEFANIKATVLSANDGFFKLGTTYGLLSGFYSRNQFQQCPGGYLGISSVNRDVEYSLRETARLASFGSGQGYLSCQCNTDCKSNRCRCLKKDVKCNSRCHNSLSCSNK